MVETNCRYTVGNKDDITEAVHGLNIFTKNWCMNCKETDEKNDYDMSDFGSMGSH